MAKKLSIAVIQFPGTNTEVETLRELTAAGMRAESFRWNESSSKLSMYDGFVIGGGFSYEDRVRAGVIASLDPIMDAVKKESEKGKAVLGICNGAQIILEAGMIPGAQGYRLGMALARNKRIQNDTVLGTGYYNTWVKLKVMSNETLFTYKIPPSTIIDAPIAHGEGRFCTGITGLLERLSENGQMVFRYCDRNGAMTNEYPINPNGAAYNLAGACNPVGNVMALMPHLERSKNASRLFFESMREGMLASMRGTFSRKNSRLTYSELPATKFNEMHQSPKSMTFNISLIITDNTAETVELTLQRLGFEDIKVRRSRMVYVEYSRKPDLKKMAKKLITSGLIMNTNKEWATVRLKNARYFYDAKKQIFFPDNLREAGHEAETAFSFLVRDREDFVGSSYRATLRERLKFPEIESVGTATAWTIRIRSKNQRMIDQTLRRILETHLFFNPHSQVAYKA